MQSTPFGFAIPPNPQEVRRRQRLEKLRLNEAKSRSNSRKSHNGEEPRRVGSMVASPMTPPTKSEKRSPYKAPSEEKLEINRKTSVSVVDLPSPEEQEKDKQRSSSDSPLVDCMKDLRELQSLAVEVQSNTLKTQDEVEKWKAKYEGRLRELELAIRRHEKTTRTDIDALAGEIMQLDEIARSNMEMRLALQMRVLKDAPTGPPAGFSLQIAHAGISFLHSFLFYIALLRDYIFGSAETKNRTLKKSPDNTLSSSSITAFEKLTKKPSTTVIQF